METKASFVRLSKGIRGCLTDHIFRLFSKPLELPYFVLEEAVEVQARRADLHQQLDRLETAHSKISNIHKAVCTQTTVQRDLLGVSAPHAASTHDTDSLSDSFTDQHAPEIQGCGSPDHTDSVTDPWSLVFSSGYQLALTSRSANVCLIQR